MTTTTQQRGSLFRLPFPPVGGDSMNGGLLVERRRGPLRATPTCCIRWRLVRRARPRRPRRRPGRLKRAPGPWAAFAAADVQAPGYAQAALTPDVLILIGRSLIRSGEVLILLDVADAGSLQPVADWDVSGAYAPSSWLFRATLSGPPSITQRSNVPAAGVLHLRYAFEARRPWQGIGPLQFGTWRAGCRPKRPRRWPTKRAGRGVPCCLSPLTATIRPSRN